MIEAELVDELDLLQHARVHRGEREPGCGRVAESVQDADAYRMSHGHVHIRRPDWPTMTRPKRRPGKWGPPTRSSASSSRKPSAFAPATPSSTKVCQSPRPNRTLALGKYGAPSCHTQPL